jgi:hypothetical protein
MAQVEGSGTAPVVAVKVASPLTERISKLPTLVEKN